MYSEKYGTKKGKKSMVNLLKGELYKLRKAKSFYICCMVFAVFIVMVYGMIIMAEKIQKGEMQNGSYGVTVTEESMAEEGQKPLAAEVSVLEVLGQMMASFGIFTTAIFIAVFVVGDYGNGAVKNIVGKGMARWKIFVVKYSFTILAAAVLLLIMTVLTVLAGIIFKGTGIIGAQFFREIAAYAGVQIMLGLALAGIIVFVSELCRNLSAAISIGIGILLFSSALTGLLDMGAHYLLPDAGFRFSDYWIVDLISNCPIKDIESGFLLRAVIMTIVWIALSLAGGIWHFKKADIK